MINKNRVKECRTMSEANQERSGQEIELIKERILAALEMVIDPELGIDIVNLGLIYDIEFNPENGETVIKMTLWAVH